MQVYDGFVGVFRKEHHITFGVCDVYNCTFSLHTLPSIPHAMDILSRHTHYHAYCIQDTLNVLPLF